MKSITFFDSLSKWSLYLLVFLLPLWFLPFTQDALNFQKQVLLAGLAFVALIAFLAKTVNAGELTIRPSWIHAAVLGLVVVVALSALFSQWQYGSFWGFPLDITDNLLTVFLFAVVYFLVAFSLGSSSELFRLGLLLVTSFGVAGLFTLAQLYGLFLLPFAFAKSQVFNTLGTANSVAVSAAVLLPLAIILSSAAKKFLRFFLLAVAAVLVVTLLLINFLDAWIVLIAGLLVLSAFGMWNMKRGTALGWVSLPMALLVLALFFIVFRVSLPGAPVAPVEVSPSVQAEMDILQNVLKESPVLGTGPGTFVFNYTKYHTADLNQTVFWGTRFGSGASEVLDWVVTKGILGGLALLGLLGAALFFGIKGLARSKADTLSGIVGLGMFASLVAAIVAFIMYPSNFSLWFTFWVLLGGLAMFLGGEQRKISLAPPSFLAVVSSFVFLLVLIFGLGLVFVSGQKYVAEAKYVSAVRAANLGELDNAIARLLSAVRLNPSVDLYWRDLSQLYLSQINQISQNQELKQEERTQLVQTAVTNAVSTARRAVEVNPANIANWNVQGFVYRNLIQVQGAAEVVFASYQKATELDPASPFSWTEFARSYILQAQALQNQKDTADKRAEALAMGLEKLNKAIELKQDYAPAHFLVAVIFDQQGKTKEAIAKLVETKTVAPNDLGVVFQLGVMYWQDNQLENAKKEFEAVLQKEPNHANALYTLGLVYDKQGNKVKAKEIFARVLELNPDNEQIKKILDNLNKNKPALEGVTPTQPPVEETPPEIGS